MKRDRVSAVKQTCQLSSVFACILLAHSSLGQNCPVARIAFPTGVDESQAWAISSDGETVVGRVMGVGNPTAFVWSRNREMQFLTAEGFDSSLATGVSADGSVVVGIYQRSSDPSTRRAFRWTASGGSIDLGSFSNSANAWGVSDNGDVVVGDSVASDGSVQAFRWDANGGMRSLGKIVGGTDSWAYGVSANGAVVVGASNVSGSFRAIRWTAESGVSELPGLDGYSSVAYAVSADGNAVVGWAKKETAGTGFRAFRWSASTGVEFLPVLPGGKNAFAWSVSRDGSVIAGTSDNASGLQLPVVWSDKHGVLPIGVGDKRFIEGIVSVSGDGTSVSGSARSLIDGGPLSAYVWNNCCAADFHIDGFLDFSDFDAFVNSFEAGVETADRDGSGFISFEDFDRFVSLFEAGC